MARINYLFNEPFSSVLVYVCVYVCERSGGEKKEEEGKRRGKRYTVDHKRALTFSLKLGGGYSK